MYQHLLYYFAPQHQPSQHGGGLVLGQGTELQWPRGTVRNTKVLYVVESSKFASETCDRYMGKVVQPWLV